MSAGGHGGGGSDLKWLLVLIIVIWFLWFLGGGMSDANLDKPILKQNLESFQVNPIYNQNSNPRVW